MPETNDNSATHYRTRIVDGVDMFYREAGPPDAPVVLALHGFPTSSRMYRHLIPLLSDTYRVIAPDYPGFGHSGVPDPTEFSYTFDGLAAIVDHLLDQLSVDRYALYVMDFGAPVGYRLALAHPDRVSAIVMQNAPLFPEAPAGWWATLGAYWKDGSPAHREAARSYLTATAMRDQYVFGVSDPSLLDPDSWTIDVALAERPGVDEIMLDLLFDIQHNRPIFAAMQDHLRADRTPTLVATGANDEIFPVDVVRRIEAEVPGVEFHAIDSGHFALEDKAPEIAALMRDFLGRVLSG